MANQGRDYLRPLCPTHYETMVISPMTPNQPTVARALDTGEIHDCECLVDGCPQHYSPAYGYFTVAQNHDHWVATGSASLRIRRRSVQVLCGEHQHSMFLECFDRETPMESLRCPESDCQRTMKILAGGAPVYWLDEGFYKKS